MAVVVLLMLTKVEAQLCLLLTSLCLEVRIHGVVFVISSHYHCVTPLPLHATAAVLYCSSCTHHCSGQGWSLLSADSPGLSHHPGENVPCYPSQQHHQPPPPSHHHPAIQPCTFIFNYLHFEGLSPVPIDLALDIELFSSLQDKLSQLPAVAEPAAKYELERRQ